MHTVGGKMYCYDLISSPMMLNEVLRQRVVELDNLITQTAASSGYSSDTLKERSGSLDGRGHTRTATTLLDLTATKDELDRYNRVSSTTRRHKVDDAMPQLLSEMRRQSSSTSPLERLQHSPNQVSIYSGPLHNNRIMDVEGVDSMASIADKLANARIMAKSVYTWDQNAACARIRLGDGAILQNLYPSHSHVKLLSGKIERIDVYSKRFINDRELLKEVTLIKDYEYKQWARTKPLNEREYSQNSKPLPLERIESKYTQPSWDTMRAMNSTASLSTRHRLFSYDDLAAKFAEPKFLKRMGFIEKESDFYRQNKENQPTESEKDRDNNNETEQQHSTATDPDSIVEDDQDYIDDDRLSSDDEEYHQPEPDIQSSLQPERVPSSLRSSRQQLAIYKDDGIIGRKSTVNRQNANIELEPIDKPPNPPNKEKKKRTQSLKKPAAPVAMLNMRQEGHIDVINDEDPASKQKNIYPVKTVRRSKSYKLDVSSNSNHRRFIPFSQPVCLCPKLSKETLASFYSPMMQHYFASNSKNGYMKCKLHGPNALDKDSTVLKSL